MIVLHLLRRYNMATLLGGSRWDDEMTPLDDDWYSYKTEQERKENPLDMDYIPEKYRDDDTLDKIK